MQLAIAESLLGCEPDPCCSSESDNCWSATDTVGVKKRNQNAVKSEPIIQSAGSKAIGTLVTFNQQKHLACDKTWQADQSNKGNREAKESGRRKPHSTTEPSNQSHWTVATKAVSAEANKEASSGDGPMLVSKHPWLVAAVQKQKAPHKCQQSLVGVCCEWH